MGEESTSPVYIGKYDNGKIEYKPLDNIVELIVRRDVMTQYNAVNLILAYCSQKALKARKKSDMFRRGMEATMDYMHEEVFK